MTLLALLNHPAWALNFTEAPAFGLGWLLFGGFIFLILVGLSAALAFRFLARNTPKFRPPA